MTTRTVLLIGAILAAVLSFAGCLDSPDALSSPEQGELKTLTNARVTRDGAALLIRGTSDGVDASVRSSRVTFEGDASLGGEPGIIQDGCYKCVCTETPVCICRPVDCP